MTTVNQLSTPTALIDLPRMERNIARMQRLMDEPGAKFRPHVKTSKCVEVEQAQIARLALRSRPRAH